VREPVAAAPNRATAFAIALFQELARAGVRDVCLCPGSRSTPLAMATAQQRELRCWTHIDERSAGFFALGLAKASRAPVALVCTSGTAAANFLPAVIEAHYACVPLLLLTADRPPELRECGAGQTIDQVHLYGRHVRWFAEPAPPEAGGSALRAARALASRAVATAAGRPAGPVHLNLPFREPLEPREVPGDVPADLAERDPLAAAGRGRDAFTAVTVGAPLASNATADALAGLVRTHARGVIACGPLDDPDALPAAVARLARLAGWPLLADPTSQLRRGPHVGDAPVIAASDLFLRDEAFASDHAPEVILRLGGTPTSKALRLWIERQAPEHLLLIDPDGGWNDPSHLASQVLHVDPTALFAAVCERIESGPVGARGVWLADFVAAERRALAAIDACLAEENALLEPRAVRELADALPDAALLYVSNSMPVRDVDAFLPASPRPLRVLCNRGANGIDGMLSSALGAAAAGCGRVTLLTGDLAFAHDIGGLLAAHRHGLDANIVVLNNDGGGIFSYLPVAAYADPADFEANFRTPHGVDFEPAARGFGASFTRVESTEHFSAARKENLDAPGTHVIELPIDRDRSVAHHHRIQAAVAAALGEGRAAGEISR
jgi:2-succinyl-5-enolpyruvyl-6-hydroxy-3-cyclohexene-1-carboxylate synthase